MKLTVWPGRPAIRAHKRLFRPSNTSKIDSLIASLPSACIIAQVNQTFLSVRSLGDPRSHCLQVRVDRREVGILPRPRETCSQRIQVTPSP